MPKKMLDTNLIVYSVLDDHPASKICESLIRDRRYTFYTTPLTVFEVYLVLSRIYGVKTEEATSKALSLFKSPLRFIGIRPGDAEVALKRCIDYGLDANDSLLIQACLNEDIPSLASDDRRLLKACEEEGILPQTPIGEEHRRTMDLWEREKLAPSGLPRLLNGMYRWLEKEYPKAARPFFEATGGLRRLPA